MIWDDRVYQFVNNNVINHPVWQPHQIQIQINVLKIGAAPPVGFIVFYSHPVDLVS